MGRESVAVCRWGDNVAEVQLHLDSKELTIRGDIKAKISRQSISDVALQPDGFSFSVSSETVFLECSPAEAQRWQAALNKTPPTLAEKFGLGDDGKAFLIGETTDDALLAALNDHTVSTADESDLLIAIVEQRTDLDAALNVANKYPNQHIWFVYQKGKMAKIGDAEIRTAARAVGLADSKTSAVSDTLTATRYRLGKNN